MSEDETTIVGWGKFISILRYGEQIGIVPPGRLFQALIYMGLQKNSPCQQFIAKVMIYKEAYLLGFHSEKKF